MHTTPSVPFIKQKFIASSLKALLGAALFSSTVAGVANASPWPVGVVDQAEVTSEKTITIPVIANDIGSDLAIIEVNTTTKRLGSASISADKKSVTYQSADEFVGTDSFWYAFKDNQGRTNAAKVTVTVTEQETRPSEWPSAGYESPEVKYNTPTEIAVLANDQGVGLTITQVNSTSVKLGSVSISSDGQKLLYTPPEDYSGNDEFWYVFSDAWGRTNAGKVTPTVLADDTGSAWPTATPDYASTVSTQSVAIPVLKNDSGNGLKLIEVNSTSVRLGKASIRNGYIRYVPPVNLSGRDSFWYAFEDNQGRTNSTQIFVDVTKNTELSSIAFCGANYFTDGTLENTSTSQAAPDPDAVELDTSPDNAEFVSPEGALAIVGNRRYLLETNALNKQLVVEENGQRTVLHAFSEDRIYGVGVKDNAFIYAISPADQSDRQEGVFSSAVRHNLMTHDGSKIQPLGSYVLGSLTGKIVMMETDQSILLRFSGYENIGEGPEVVIIPPGPANNMKNQYYEINTQDGLAMYLGNHQPESGFGNRVGRSRLLKVLNYDQHLIRSVHNTSQNGAFPGPNSHFLQSTTHQGIAGSIYAKLDKAIVSKNRLLLTTVPHANSVYTGGNGGGITNFPAKLFSFDSMTGKFVRLATCN